MKCPMISNSEQMKFLVDNIRLNYMCVSIIQKKKSENSKNNFLLIARMECWIKLLE